MDFAVVTIIEINIFRFYTNDHKKADYSHYGLELALSSLLREDKAKKKKKLGTFSLITVMALASNLCNMPFSVV